MECGEAQECVSALTDGQVISAECAAHIGDCERCQELVRDFSLIGGELRRWASRPFAEGLPARTWVNQQRWTAWWTKGWETMRVPRIVFASLAVIVLGLSSRLWLVEARAHSAGTVMVLRLRAADGGEIVCPISVDAKRGGCSGMSQIDGQVLAYSLAFVRQEGDRVLLRVRSEFPAGSMALSPEVAKRMPGSDLWFAPGESGELVMAGGVKMQITGEWIDHVPIFIGEAGDPAAGELRVISPVILKDGKVVGDLQGMSATAVGQKYGVVLFLPGEGRFSFSPVSITGSMEAKVSVNRVSFVENEQTYQVVGGLPVTRARSVWVRHEPAATGLGGETDRSEAGTELLSQMR